MSVFGNPLFQSEAHSSLESFLRSRIIGGVTQDIDKITAAQFEQHTDHDLAVPIVERHRVKALRLLADKSKGDVKPTTVKSRNEFNELFVSEGFMVRKSIPYEGDSALFRYQPSTISSHGPPSGVVIVDSVTVGMDVPANQTDAAERHITKTVENIKQQIEWQRQDIDRFNEALPADVQSRVAARRAALKQAADLAKKLSGD